MLQGIITRYFSCLPWLFFRDLCLRKPLHETERKEMKWKNSHEAASLLFLHPSGNFLYKIKETFFFSNTISEEKNISPITSRSYSMQHYHAEGEDVLTYFWHFHHSSVNMYLTTSLTKTHSHRARMNLIIRSERNSAGCFRPHKVMDRHHQVFIKMYMPHTHTQKT